MGQDEQLPLRQIDAAFAWGVRIATFAGLDEDGRFLVRMDADEQPRVALSAVALGRDDSGASVAVAFEGADPRRPVVVGRIRERPEPAPEIQTDAEPDSIRAGLDGERLVLSAEREIELRCGEASILLTRAGKVLIRGNYVLTRSRGANKIKGAYVDIN